MPKPIKDITVRVRMNDGKKQGRVVVDNNPVTDWQIEPFASEYARALYHTEKGDKAMFWCEAQSEQTTLIEAEIDGEIITRYYSRYDAYVLREVVVGENFPGVSLILACVPSSAARYITWEKKHGDVYWGHYYWELSEAQKDFDKRLKEKREWKWAVA